MDACGPLLTASAIATMVLLTACSSPMSSTPGTSPMGTPTDMATLATPSATASMAPAETASPSTQQPATEPTITTGASDFGTILFDADRQAIYLFDREQSSVPDCYGACANAWPPVLTTGAAAAAGSVRADLLGTTERTDGTTQVTYAGHPLYYYAHEGAGEVKCHNVRQFGGLWLVIGPDGNPRP